MDYFPPHKISCFVPILESIITNIIIIKVRDFKIYHKVYT